MKHTLILLIAFFWGHWAFAELPQSLDEVLFGISGGTNYVKWMRTDGTLKFDKPFAIFVCFCADNLVVPGCADIHRFTRLSPSPKTDISLLL